MVAGQPLRDLFDLPGCVSIMTKEVNSKLLSSSLCVEFSGRGILLQFSPQRESDLRQQWFLEARAPYQGQASRITVCYLLRSAGKQMSIPMQMEGLKWFRGEASPAQFVGSDPAGLQEQVPLANMLPSPGTIQQPLLHVHRALSDQYQ